MRCEADYASFASNWQRSWTQRIIGMLALVSYARPSSSAGMSVESLTRSGSNCSA